MASLLDAAHAMSRPASTTNDTTCFDCGVALWSDDDTAPSDDDVLLCYGCAHARGAVIVGDADDVLDWSSPEVPSSSSERPTASDLLGSIVVRPSRPPPAFTEAAVCDDEDDDALPEETWNETPLALPSSFLPTPPPSETRMTASMPATMFVQTDTREAGDGYDHVVILTNGWEKTARCSVATDVNPLPVVVEVRPGARIEVVTFMGSRTPTFVARVACGSTPRRDVDIEVECALVAYCGEHEANGYLHQMQWATGLEGRARRRRRRGRDGW